MGDARLDYAELTYGFFDRFLKGETNDALDEAAEGHATSRWAQQVAVVRYLAAGGRAAADVLPGERRQGQHARTATAC